MMRSAEYAGKTIVKRRSYRACSCGGSTTVWRRWRRIRHSQGRTDVNADPLQRSGQDIAEVNGASTPSSLEQRREREPVVRNHADLIWSVADLLRGDYKPSEYGRVILPLVVLRRLDGVLSPTKEKVLSRHKALQGRLKNVTPVLTGITGVQFYNASELDLHRVLDDPPNAADALRQYVAGFSEEVREVFDKFDLDAQISRLDSSNLLYLVLGNFVDIDLGPESVSNTEMGYIYEELIRKFSELSKETAGEHFTPREVVELMVNLLFIEDDDLLSKPGTVKTMLDPACGTGGMLSVSSSTSRRIIPRATWKFTARS